MDWVKFYLPLPCFQQSYDETPLNFFHRIRRGIKEYEMRDDETVFWFLLGAREDLISKLPFDPVLQEGYESVEFLDILKKIENNHQFNPPYREGRLQNCYNFGYCFLCKRWGHKTRYCRLHQDYKGTPSQIRAKKRANKKMNKDNEESKRLKEDSESSNFPILKDYSDNLIAGTVRKFSH